MLQQIEKVTCLAPPENPRFSILIPSWNNLAYLQLCIRSIKTHSTFVHQIIVVINEGRDGTLEWIQQQADIDYLHARENIGICYALNLARELVRTDYLLYVNDDMYLLPEWDAILIQEVDQLQDSLFMLSCTMIEPHDTGNPCVIVKDYGDQLEQFEEKRLLAEFQQHSKADWSGSTWPPNLIHKDLWDLVGGMSIEFSPGMYSDPDLSMKLWQAGVRYFKGMGKSRAYHFGSKSTKRIRRNKGKDQFLQKWGMSARFFCTRYLQRGVAFSGALQTPRIRLWEHLINKGKRLFVG